MRVLDVRWSLGGPPGRPLYEAGHIPGAVYVDLDTELARHGELHEGRHPLPAVEDFQSAARRWGLNDGDTVVVYDNWNSQAASRAWWLLRYMGVTDVRVLDGALRANATVARLSRSIPVLATSRVPSVHQQQAIWIRPVTFLPRQRCVSVTRRSASVPIARLACIAVPASLRHTMRWRSLSPASGRHSLPVHGRHGRTSLNVRSRPAQPLNLRRPSVPPCH